MEEILTKLQDLHQKLDDIGEKMDLKHKKQHIQALQARSTQPDFWQDEAKAKKTLQELSHHQEIVSSIDELHSNIAQQIDLVKLSQHEVDDSLINELQNETAILEAKLIKLEKYLFLSGPYDSLPAILSIHAGQGGTEAQDWVSMLLRMYTQYCDSNDWSYEIINQTRGEEAGLKSATIYIKAKYAYGLLRLEQGTHRLVRLSPFNADNLRQTSFALVEILPEIQEDAKLDINDDDLEWQFFRSSGKGGQNVNKVSTAVRLTHKPTQLVVESQAERTQVQNRQLALSILRAKLWERKEAQLEKEKRDIKGEHQHASWGTQIRSYVLHPYKLVKDNRTQLEIVDAQAVLDGKLDPFIDAQIKLNPSRDS